MNSFVSSHPSPQPPVAAINHTESHHHGHILVDDYAWLRDREKPEVTAWLEAENAYTAASLAGTEGLQKQLYDEMLSHIKETDVSVPVRDGEFWYYTRTEQGLQYPIHCRKPWAATATSPATPEAIDAAEEIILDVNTLAKGESYMAVGGMTVSDDGHLLAYAYDNKGFRQYTLRVKDLRTGQLLSERVERVGSLVWAIDNRTLFYTVEDEEQKRQYQFWRHRIGDAHASDVLVYEESDERFNIGAGRTRDERYLILESASHTTSEMQFLAADQPEGHWRVIQPREDGIEYYGDHRYGRFYLRVNDTGRNFRLVTAPAEAPGRENWVELIAHRPEVMLEEFDLFSSFGVACERAQGLEHLRILSFATTAAEVSTTRSIAFPEPVYSAHPASNREFDTRRYRYGYQSLVTPASVYEFDIAGGESRLLKQQDVPGNFDRSLYASERLFATADDGVEIPVSILYRRDRFSRGGNPLWIYGYGSYGYALPIGFNSNRLSLLDRGYILAYAHIRGGGDLGKPWHDAGRLMQKRNTFTDFIAVTQHLTTLGYGDPARVAAEGGSAGGLLMGAIANLRPDLYRAILSHVPFVDVMNTMLDASLPLTVPEYEEWGNPNEKEAFEYMLSYSPYDNLDVKAYPAMLVKTSLYDSQVMYWEPAKYVARLRKLKTDGRRLLLHTNMTAGHGGASGRYDYLKEIAMDYAFLLEELGTA